MEQITALYTIFVLIATACYLTPLVVLIILIRKFIKERKQKNIQKTDLIKSVFYIFVSGTLTLMLGYLFATAQITESNLSDVSNKETALFILKTTKAFLQLSSSAIVVPLSFITIYFFVKFVNQIFIYKKTNV